MPTLPNNSGKKEPSNNLNRQIGLYSLAAAVAGVSILALVEPAAGEVVVTRKMIPIPLCDSGSPCYVFLDLNNDGADDFLFDFTSYGPGSYFSRALVAYPLRGGGFIGKPEIAGVYASALLRGAKIGPSVDFYAGALIEESRGRDHGSQLLTGQWSGNPKNRYLGVQLSVNGQTHYGWIRLTVTTGPLQNSGVPMSAKITGYAYETVPNKPIKAGTAATEGAAETSGKPIAEVQSPASVHNQNQDGPSLGMLAAGADGMPLWRRGETSPRQ